MKAEEIRAIGVEKVRVEKINASFEIDLTAALHLKIILDIDVKTLSEEFPNEELGNHTICTVEFTNNQSNEKYSAEYYFKVDREIDEFRDLFIDEIRLLVNQRLKADSVGIFEQITDSNPESAWMFYKRTFDKVMYGAEIRKANKCECEIVCTDDEGNPVTLHVDRQGYEYFAPDKKYVSLIGFRFIDESLYLTYSTEGFKAAAAYIAHRFDKE